MISCLNSRHIISALILAILPHFSAVQAQVVQEGSLSGLDPRWKTDTSKRLVSIAEFMPLLTREYFYTLNHPAFIDREKGQATYFKYEPVIAIDIHGSAKAYPLAVLSYHEISNDTLKGVPLLVTYCPLCNSGVVFDRRLPDGDNELLLDFAVSGMLRKSDMVMWDRQTETWWQQLTGEGLVGQFAGRKLRYIPSMILSVEEYFERFPGGKILSPQTGVQDPSRLYSRNAYLRYDSMGKKHPSTYFFREEVDSRLPPMERVVDFCVSGKCKIYPFSEVQQQKVIHDEFMGKKIVLFYGKKTVSILDAGNIRESRRVGTVTMFSPYVKDKLLSFKKSKDKFTDRETGSVWDIGGRCVSGFYKGETLQPAVHGNHFAFAWLSFHPDSVIYGQD